MIDEIQVENVALIREANMVPSPGLTVLTGETGAGKTALLSALKLLMGARSDKDQVRDGEDSLCVSGRFYFREQRVDGLEDKTLCGSTEIEEACCEEEIVVSRSVKVDGRSRVTVNGKMASVSELASLVAPSIDLCGQHEHQKLLKSATHVSLLDAWAADTIAPLREAYQRDLSKAQASADELTRVLSAREASVSKVEEARFILKRIDAINPGEGEYEELAETLAKAEHAESLASAANGTYVALAGDEGALDKVNQAVASLESVASFDESLRPFAESLRETGYVLEDVAAEMRTYRDSVDYDPTILVDQQQRMAEFQGLLRAYGPRMEDVFSARTQAYDAVSLVDDADERERVAKKACDEAEEALAKSARALQTERERVAPLFAQKVTEQMQRLEMKGCKLICDFTSLERQEWTKVGSSQLEFKFCPGNDLQARPLARIASGGEISRVMLAIKVVQGATDTVDTLVFDEVDAGVGGSAARALGEVLATLAHSHQVIVVTHLPQVAVWGQLHYVVKKTAENEGSPETQLMVLDEANRSHEIARMLSGDVTEASLAHAEELIAATSCVR